MKWRVFLCVFVLLAVSATSLDASVLLGRNNRIDFNNWEGAFIDKDPLDLDGDGDLLEANGILDVGDTLRGVLQAQDLAPGLEGIPDVTLIGSGNPSLTAIFEIEVLAKIPDAATGGFFFTFGSTAGFVARNALPPGSMIAIYEEPPETPQDFAFLPAASPTFAATEATVTDGTLLGVFGEDPVLGHEDSSSPGGTAGQSYWVTEASTDANVFPPGGSAEFFYGLELLGGTLSAPPVIPQTSPFVFGARHPAAAAHFLDLHALVGEGDVTPMTPNGVYTTYSDDPALLSIPEPGSILIWGLLISACLAASTLRRRR